MPDSHPQVSLPEPWMRGIVPGVDPVIGHLLRASEHIWEDVTAAIGPLTIEALWARPQGMTPAGFHAKHLAGSIDRLCTYLEGRQLTEGQLAALRSENSGNESAAELIAAVRQSLDRYEVLIRALRAENFGDVREIGRKRLQTTAVSLAIHIAEHGQRHVGQLVSAAKLAKAIAA